MAVIHVGYKRFALLLSSRVPGLGDEEFLHFGPLCLELYACPDAVCPTRPIYHPIRRWVREVLPSQPQSFHVEWREFYLSLEPAMKTALRRIAHPVNASLFSPFHVDVATLLRRLSDSGVQEILPMNPETLRNPWTGHPPAAFLFRTLATFSDHNTLWEFVVTLGRCDQKLGVCNFGSHHGPLWATVTCPGGELGDEGASLLSAPLHTDTHDCASDHIDQWIDRTKLTGVLTPRAFNRNGSIVSRDVRYVQLSFTPSNLQPVGAPLRLQLVLDILKPIRPPLGGRYPGETTDDHSESSTCIEPDTDDELQPEEGLHAARRTSLSIDARSGVGRAEGVGDALPKRARRCTSLVRESKHCSKLFL